ncbi:MAG: hypothetical protein KDN20_01650 [Verrucomicrobiae bacterium]|nr:hypothetical protein [Verrucomicrobiae bacterium]
MKKTTQWILVLSGIAGLSLFGVSCNSGDDHDHGDHDHGDHEEHAEAPAEGGEQAAAAPADNYPLDVCIVSGEKLGSMGDPITIQHEGVTVKFCCDGCIDDFKEAPEKYLPKLTQAMAK